MYLYKFINKQSEKVNIFFHGTGGNETDMIPIAESIDPGAIN